MVLIEEECASCGATFNYYSLYRCYVCGKMFCRNCFIYDEEGKVICLRCAKRRIFPKTRLSKYSPLTTYLARRAKYANYVTLSFKKIEEIIGDRLPPSAYENRYWWSNTRNRSCSEAWLTAGWSVLEVNLDSKTVTFKKNKPTEINVQRKRRRRISVSPAFKALAKKRKRKKPSGPSKTKLAKAQARFKNVQREKMCVPKFRGKFKPKKAYEKRLYNLDEKPD